MSRIFLILFSISLSSLMKIQAQENPENSQDSIIFDKTTHDYGTILQFDVGRCEFKFHNKGQLPIILKNVQATCGCTMPEWPKDSIMQNQTGIIKVRYNTDNLGVFKKTIAVSSNAKNPVVILTIKGNVVTKL
jgi:hypothetical protein